MPQHEDYPMRPSSSSAQWLCGAVPAMGVDEDYRQVHAHTHFRRPMAPHKVITSLHQRPVKQALHHTNI